MVGGMAERRDAVLAAQFGKRLRFARTAQGLTQERLAEIADMHPTYVAQIERGVSAPTLTTLARLAWALDVDAGSLVTGLTPTDAKARKRATAARARR